MKLILHIPAWHHSERGDMPKREVVLYLKNMPRENEQIEVAGGGVVEVANVRHRPVWLHGTEQSTRMQPGGISEAQELAPEVFTSWAVRPEGAPITRSHRV